MEGHHLSVPKLALRFDHNEALESAKTLLENFRPELKQQLATEELVIKKVTGGITNKLFMAYFSSAEKNKTLIRVYGTGSGKMIDRIAEISMLEKLHENNCCGKVFGVFDNGMCYEYVAGEALTLKTVRDDHISRLIIKQLVQLHCVQVPKETGSVKSLDLFDKMYKFLELIPSVYKDQEKQRKFHEYFPESPHFGEEIKMLQCHLVGPDIVLSPKVFCHNDLVCSNILYDKENDRVRFIDFEYGGLNFQAYDIANHFNEFAGVEDCDYSRYPSREFQLSWLSFYLKNWNESRKTERRNGKIVSDEDKEISEEEQVEALYLTVNKFTLASHLFWILWALIQAENSQIDFDYLKYGKKRFEEYTKRKAELLKK